MPHISIDQTNKVTGIYAKAQKNIQTVYVDGPVELGWRYDPDTQTVVQPPLRGGMTLSQYKDSKIAEANQICYQKIISGFTSSALGSPHKYQSEETDQFNTLANLTIAQQNNISVSQKCVEIATGIKSWKSHTPAQILQVFTEGGAHVTAMLQRKDVLAKSIKDAASFDDVDSIDLNSGW